MPAATSGDDQSKADGGVARQRIYGNSNDL
jgi:hypothetical protein